MVVLEMTSSGWPLFLIGRKGAERPFERYDARCREFRLLGN
jgi:hypothetical protein